MPLDCCRFIAAHNRCSSGVRAALPELILIYEPSPITTQARHYATQGSIMTAALPYDCGLTALLLQIGFLLLAVSLPRFVMHQDVSLGLLIQDVNIVVCHVDNPGPQAARINHLRDGRSFRATRDQHRHQACD